MMISVVVTLNDGKELRLIFNHLDDFTAWCTRHHGHYKRFKAKTIKIGILNSGGEKVAE